MPKSDPAHRETDKLLAKMEAEIKSVYTQAYKEAQQTADSFMKQFTEADAKKREALENGDISKEEYARWQRTQLFQGKRYQQMADTLSKDLTNSNKIAASVINGHLPEVYALNHNYGTYEMESGGRVNTQYTLYDRQTVERLLRDDPDLLPHARVDIPKDLIWNKKSINSAITQGILQGEDIDTISQRLAHTVTDMSRTSAIRNARTMTTSAENGGRIDSYKRAESMGIKMVQVWVATLDSRTRHEHRQLDGQKRKIGEPFTVDGYEIDFPADPKAEAFLVYNCRCTLIGQVQGVNFDLSDTTSRDNKLGDMSYEQWKEDKRKLSPEKKESQEQNKQRTVEETQKMMKQKQWMSVFVNMTGNTVDNNERIDLSGCDAQGAEMIFNAFDIVMKRYPQLQGKLGGVGIATHTKSEYAYVVSGGTRVYYNPEFFSNSEEFRQTYKEGVEERWHPQGTTADSVIVHEIGHAIDNFLGGKSQSVRTKVLKELGLKVADVQWSLGQYATKNAREWWADCFAEYMTSPEPRKMAAAFGKELEKLMDKIK